MSRQAFEEGRLRFVFTPGRQVEKYDESTFYRKHLEKIPGTKAVDFLVFSEKQTVLVEVKDFRGHRIKNKARLTSGELVDEIAQKVKDTCAAFVPRARRGETVRQTTRLLDPEHRIRVVLWLEEDASQSPRLKAQRGILTNALKKKLTWLTSKVHVVDRNAGVAVPGIERVESLPGAGGTSNR